MNRSFVYCDMCKVNHCGQKAFNLYPEDKATWILKENEGVRVCDTHKEVLISFCKAEEKDFISLNRKERSS